MPLEMRNAQIGGIGGAGQSARIVAPQMILGRVFPGKAEQVRDVRRWVREALPPCPARDDAEAIASELAANAVVHTASGQPGGTFAAYLAWSPDRARIVIADGGAATGPVLVRDSAGERQRGLAVVDSLAITWAHVGGGDCRWTWADVAWNGASPHVPAGGEADVADELRKLRAAYPGVLFWYGEFTGTWWTASGSTLIDVPCPAALAVMAASLFAASRPPGERPPDSRPPSAGIRPPVTALPQSTPFRKRKEEEGG